MKPKFYSTLLCAALFAACTSTQTNQAVTSAADIADLAINGLQDYQSAQSGTLTPAQFSSTITTASADLNGIATIAQAYVGKTPAQANVAQGASTSAVGNAVQSALPNTPITQAQVNTLYNAAALVLKKK